MGARKASKNAEFAPSYTPADSAIWLNPLDSGWMSAKVFFFCIFYVPRSLTRGRFGDTYVSRGWITFNREPLG